MRGDSRRDLYSKTLALCGLGVLAGAGALVDYWPVGVRFPLAASPVSAAPAIQTAGMSSDDALSAAALLIDASTPDVVAVAREPEHPALVAVIRTFESLPVMPAGFEMGTTLDAPPPAPLFVTVGNEIPVLPGRSVRLSAPRAQRLDRGFPAAAAASDADEGDGFLTSATSAFRKTGSSIVKGGVRTGTSLVDAVRIVGGMFRRALPD